MGKLKQRVPKLEDYKAPWEIDADGNDVPEEEQQLDPARLKKYVHGLLTDKQSAQESRDSETERANQLQAQLDEKLRESETDEQRREREQEDERRKAGDAEKLSRLKLEVALDVEGISAQQAKRLAPRLIGTTREELEANAEDFIEQWGLPGQAPDPDGQGEEDEGDTRFRRRPQPVGRTHGDPRPTATPSRSFDDELAEIPRPGGNY